jgi:SAM-dependent methyltransferase
VSSTFAEYAGGASARLRSTAARMTAGRRLGRERFSLAGREYGYEVHAYNQTWTNERAVELALALDALRRHPSEDVLELGNVLGHYVARSHDVVDKYEQAPGVINSDVLDFQPGRRYSLVVSISTLEHVGFEEEVADPSKPARVVEHLSKLLARGGELLFTFPLGYNTALDEQLRAGALPFSEVAYMRRISSSNRWVEARADEVIDADFGKPYPRANALVVARRRGS